MWVIENSTPFSAERNWFIDKNGAKSWVVAVKASYDIHPDGAPTISPKQEPVLLTEVFRGEPGKSSLIYESDLSGPKQATDVLINGHVYAPDGGWATTTDAAFSVGNLSKTIRVSGDRRWDRLAGALVMSDPEPFAKIPLCYERAFGGCDTKSNDPAAQGFEPRNPIGTGFAMRSGHVAGAALPNIEYPRDRVSSWTDRPRPAGFSAVYAHWTPRRNYAGTYDDTWIQSRFPLWPEDFDERFFHCSPEDQQVPGYLRGGEAVQLLNLTAEGTLKFQLPRVHLVFSTFFRGRSVEHRARLHTVVIEPDWPRVLMVWFTGLRVQNNADDLDVTVVGEKQYLR